MELDRAIREWFALIAELDVKHGVGTAPDAARRRAAEAALTDELFEHVTLPGPDIARIADRRVPVAGGEIRVRHYRPDGPAPQPVHVTLHGGGFTTGSIDDRVVDALCRERAAGAACSVISVDYRLAPEHRFPTALEDCHRALEWVVEHASELEVDPDNISIGGASAGGNLAAAVAILARDRGGPRLVLQLLEVPMLDFTLSGGSAAMFAEGFGFAPDDLAAVTGAYLADPAQVAHPLVSPLLAEDLAGLPPAHILTAEFDPLRDGAEAYATRLAAAGVPTTSRRHGRHVHGSPGLTRTFAPARTWQHDAIGALRRAHARPTPFGLDQGAPHAA
jgi:acetyl esterase